MLRYYEYTNAEGVRKGAMHNFGAESRQRANDDLAALCAKEGRTDVHVYEANEPEWKTKSRINAIRKENGEPPRFDDWEATDPELRPKSVAVASTLTDHADGSTIETPITPTSAPTLSGEPIYGAPRAMEITDHADRAVASRLKAVHSPPQIVNASGQPAVVRPPTPPTHE